MTFQTDGSNIVTDEVVQALPGLRQFARSAQPAERCELCGFGLESDHQHLLERTKHQITCACDACTILFCGQQGARYLRIPRHVRQLQDFSLSDLEWEEMMIPINLAYFIRNASGQVSAMYPSPAGAIESELSLESLGGVFEEYPALQAMEPEVEALLVNRAGDSALYLIVPIDECFRLVGLIRTKWRGLSGGTEVWGAVRDFFSQLQSKSAGSARKRYA